MCKKNRNRSIHAFPYNIKKQQWKNQPQTNKNGFLKRETENREEETENRAISLDLLCLVDFTLETYKYFT